MSSAEACLRTRSAGAATARATKAASTIGEYIMDGHGVWKDGERRAGDAYFAKELIFVPDRACEACKATLELSGSSSDFICQTSIFLAWTSSSSAIMEGKIQAHGTTRNGHWKSSIFTPTPLHHACYHVLLHISLGQVSAASSALICYEYWLLAGRIIIRCSSPRA